eukprot:COSAG06_NODE_1118_length_10635_cov_5.052946_9_plen_101_part_00
MTFLLFFAMRSRIIAIAKWGLVRILYASLIVVGGLGGEHCGLAVKSCFKCCGCKQAALQSPPGCLVLGGTWLLNMPMCTFRGWSTMGYILILMEGLLRIA